ncbi:hypothetical protein V9T40_004091 [Parthenolecanium corni]|uniref:Uncharacterized protein n=1 Tax=Parthenolecanium corni TaxID=536013 RepID=A0AAN9TE85_9HEMI
MGESPKILIQLILDCRLYIKICEKTQQQQWLPSSSSSPDPQLLSADRGIPGPDVHRPLRPKRLDAGYSGLAACSPPEYAKKNGLLRMLPL